MASSVSMILLECSFLMFSSYFDGARAQSRPIVPGLSWNYYDVSCPNLEAIVREQLKEVLEKDIGQAAGLLRLHFHDCFVQVHIIIL